MYTKEQLEDLRAEYYDRWDEARGLAADYAKAGNMAAHDYYKGMANAFADAIDMLDELIDKED